MKSRLFAAAAFACALAGAVTAAQQPAPAPQAPSEAPPPTFRVDVNYIEVDAVVTDAQGNTITNLTADDFEVLEDGKPQKVSAFSRLDLPIERTNEPIPGAGPIEPDVQTNSGSDGRLYVLVLDDLHTSFTNTARVKRALHQFIDRYFGSNDIAAVVFTGQRAIDAQDFTGNRRLILAAIDRFIGRNLPSATSERFNGLSSNCGAAGLDPDNTAVRAMDPCEAERGFNARNTLNSIKRIADFLAGVRGRRKAMLWVSEGISYDINDVFNNRAASAVISDTQDAIAAATRSNVAIYAIDPRGLSAIDTIEIDSTPQNIGNDSLVRGLQNELQLSQDSLRTLADETGGFAATGSNDLNAAFTRIVRENSSYYVLGYYPANSRRDGKYRKIEVRVKRPGLQVRARRGYVAPRGRAPENKSAGDNAAAKLANEAIASPIPIAGLPISVFAAAFKGTAPNALIAMSVDMRVDRFQFRDASGTFNDRAEVAFTVTDAAGKVRNSGRNTLAFNLRPQTLASAREHGIRVLMQQELPAGRYQMRVAVGEEGGTAGSVLYDLEVPDFYSAPLTMSGLVLTSAAAAQTPTLTPQSGSALSSFLPGPPITTREFTRAEEIALFAEFYENLPNAPAHQLDITLQLKAADGGRVVASDTEQRSSTELNGQRGGYGFAATLPLKDVPPGVYVLHLEGRSRTEKGGTVSRDVQIRVR